MPDKSRPLTRSEELQLEAIRELCDSTLFDVHYEQQALTFPLADFDPLSQIRKEWEHIELSAPLKERALRFKNLSCDWSVTDTDLEVAGEFRLPHLYRAFLGVPPRHNDLATDSERALLAELRIVDSAPVRATGEAAFIRMQPHKSRLEIWYQDRYLFDARRNTQCVSRMEIDYCEYLDMLRVTKGAFGWQLLFTETSLGGAEFRPHVQNLRGMLEVFPSAFPQYDYTFLRERLEARL